MVSLYMLLFPLPPGSRRTFRPGHLFLACTACKTLLPCNIVYFLIVQFCKRLLLQSLAKMFYSGYNPFSSPALCGIGLLQPRPVPCRRTPVHTRNNIVYVFCPREVTLH